MSDRQDDDIRKVFQRYEKLLFKAANSVREESAHGFFAKFSQKIDEAKKTFKEQTKKVVNKDIPKIDATADSMERLRRAGANYETANVKLTTYVQMVSKLTASAEEFKDRIQARIEEDEKKGVTTTVTALKDYIKSELQTGQGITVTYSNGAKMPTDKYAAMLARTTRIETGNVAMLGKALDSGNDLVECSTEASTCPLCAIYQGRIYSVTGKTPGYPALYKTAFKHGYSIIHPNCRHQFFPYDPKFHTKEEIEELEKSTHRSWEPDTESRHFQQTKAAAEQYAKSQTQMREWNRELNEYAEYKRLCEERGEKPTYTTLGSFRRAYRSGEGTLAYAKSHYARRDARQYEEFKEALGKENIPESLAKFQEMKYNEKEEFELFVGYKTANKRQHISPLVSFKVYKQVSKEIDEKLVGQTIGGIQIKGKVTHFIDRVIGEYQESDYPQKGKRQGVPVDALMNIINKNPQASKTKINARGEKSVSFDYGGYRLTVNPDKGILVQTNKVKK